MDDRSDVLRHEYELRFTGSEVYRESVWKILYSDFFHEYVDASAPLLDLGAGWGEFSRQAVATRKYAMDLNPDCGRRLAGHAEFLMQDCSTTWPLQDDVLGTVFTSNFLEHLPDKISVERTLEEAFRCLRPGGRIVCMGPNIKYLAGPYWDFWDHHVQLTELSLAEVLTMKGFRVTHRIDRFLPYTMSDGRRPPLIALKAYLRLRFAWRFFGKQFLVIAEK